MSLLLAKYITEQAALNETRPPSYTTHALHPYIYIPVTLGLVYRSYSHSSLTPIGILVAAFTAVIHALHPSPIPFTLLVVFFLLGTTATKIKQDVKATLTLSSTGAATPGSTSSASRDQESSAEAVKPAVPVPHGAKVAAHPRSAIQVLANSGCSTILCLLHLYVHHYSKFYNHPHRPRILGCFGHESLTPVGQQLPNILLAGIIANYAAVTADTLSSELGILSSLRPRLITTMREVPPGTNGGITGAGLFAGLGGALTIGLISVALLPICNKTDFWTIMQGEGAKGDIDSVGLVLVIGAWGALGSVLDSFLGAILQASVVDRRSGKIVESLNGGRVKITAKHAVDGNGPVDDGGTGKPSREIGSGRDILDNNQINYLMASIMTIGGMFIAGYVWKVPAKNMWISMGFK